MDIIEELFKQEKVRYEFYIQLKEMKYISKLLQNCSGGIVLLLAQRIFYLDLIMGNQQVKQIVKQQPFPSTHPLFQKASIINEGGKNYLQASLPVQTKDYEAWKSLILDSKNPLNHEFLLLPEHTGFAPDKELCGNAGTAINNYPYYPTNLADEIRRRAPLQEHFKESELWYLLFALATAKADMNNFGNRVGDIKPQNVFIDSERRAKVVNLYSSPLETSAFQRAKDYENPALNSLLAPEDLRDLVNNSINNNGNSKSEVFAIGATVLGAGLLDDLRGVYNYKKLQLQPNELASRIDRWSAHPHYSEIFKSTVLSLLQEDPNKRISGEDLYRFISRYEGSIKNKEQFIITHPPENIENGVSLVRSKIHL